MGKEVLEPVAALEDPAVSASPAYCCSKANCKWPISVILGVYVLVFALWTFGFRRSNGNDPLPASPPPWIPRVEASFRLPRSVLAIHESLPQLQVDLQNEIGIPDTQIDIVSIAPLSYKNWTEIRFTVSPDKPSDSIASLKLRLLKDTFVELFMQRSANLSLTNTVFGSVSNFEVLQFPGGITVVPPQPGFPLSPILVLFNFTLHNTLSRVNCNFAKFKQQLADGIGLSPNEKLFVQLTNVEGSTVSAPVVVQTSILPVVGMMLPFLRLKELAWVITTFPDKNLGLNHSFFGEVREIDLSSYLKYSLDSAQTPSLSPAPAPSYSPWSSPGISCNHKYRGHKHHVHSIAPAASHNWRRQRQLPTRIAPTPQSSYRQRPEGAPPPIYSPSQPSVHSQSSFPPSSLALPPSAVNPGSSPQPTMAASPPTIYSPPKQPPAKYGQTVAPSPNLSKDASEGSAGLTPGASPSPSKLLERIALAPGASPPSSLAATSRTRLSMWILVICMVLSIIRW